MSSIAVRLTLALGMLFGSARITRAQAWVSDKGNLDASLDYNLGISDKVVGASTAKFPNAGTTTNQFTLGADYVPVEHLGLALSLPFAALKYTGDKNAYPHPGGGRYDDGAYHGTLTDLAFRARYQLPIDQLAISPHIGFSVPVANYETVGNTVAGRHLKQLHLGVAIGKFITDDFYGQVVYEYSFVGSYDRTADTAKYGQNHSDLAAALGYKVLDGRLDINANLTYRVTHGGINFEEFSTLPADVIMYHDPVLAEKILLIGAGVGYPVSNTVTVSAAAAFFITGSNTQNASVFDLSVGWTIL